MPEPSAGWCPDPFGRHELRYWEGSRWTDHVVSRGNQEIDPPVASTLEPTPDNSLPPGAWHSDPFGRHELRYWDGSRWTDHVASRGLQGADPPVGTPSVSTTKAAPAIRASLPAAPPQASRGAKKIQQQVQKVGLADMSGEPVRAIFEESALVINQKGKLLELRAEYAIHNQNGLQLAAVRGKRMSSRMQVVDMNGRQLLDLRREGSIVRSKVMVGGANGGKIGRIVPSLSWNELDRDFKLEGADNTLIGAVYAEDRSESGHRQRHREFNVQDASGAVVAHISKTRAGVAKELLTRADNYVVDIPRPLSDQLRSLSIAAVLVIDAAFHQR